MSYYRGNRALKFLSGKETDSANLHKIVALANMVYNTNDALPFSKHFEWYKANRESYLYAIDNFSQQLLGYICALPIRNDYFFHTTETTFDEKEIPGSWIVSFKEPGEYSLYLCSIVIDPRSPNRSTIFKGLINRYEMFLEELGKEGKYVNKASAIAVSPQGQKICEVLGMSNVGQNEDGYSIYHSDSIDGNDNFFKRLAERAKK